MEPHNVMRLVHDILFTLDNNTSDTAITGSLPHGEVAISDSAVLNWKASEFHFVSLCDNAVSHLEEAEASGDKLDVIELKFLHDFGGCFEDCFSQNFHRVSSLSTTG
jgi:hypothetical protein